MCSGKVVINQALRKMEIGYSLLFNAVMCLHALNIALQTSRYIIFCINNYKMITSTRM